jgi:hypothetical protein
MLTVDGSTYSISIPQALKWLAQTSSTERNLYQMSPFDYDIHRFTIHEDLPVNRLIHLASDLRSQNVFQ